jgi:hypothetical protein
VLIKFYRLSQYYILLVTQSLKFLQMKEKSHTQSKGGGGGGGGVKNDERWVGEILTFKDMTDIFFVVS